MLVTTKEASKATGLSEYELRRGWKKAYILHWSLAETVNGGGCAGTWKPCKRRSAL